MHHIALTHRQRHSILANCSALWNIICLFLDYEKKFEKEFYTSHRLSYRGKRQKQQHNNISPTYHGWIDVKWNFERCRHINWRVERRKCFNELSIIEIYKLCFRSRTSEEIFVIVIIVMNYVVCKGKEMIFCVRYYDLMKKILLLMRWEASRMKFMKIVSDSTRWTGMGFSS